MLLAPLLIASYPAWATGDQKMRNLDIEELKRIIEVPCQETCTMPLKMRVALYSCMPLMGEAKCSTLAWAPQNDFSQGQYYITGRLTAGIFADDCAFIDPTTDVKSPAVYSKAVATLFDKDSSRADLIDIKVRHVYAAGSQPLPCA